VIDLWTEASRDVEAERLALRMASAKVAVAGLWPFLALAQSPSEFDHRLALAADHIANAVPVDLLHPVVASLREDFAAITAAKDAEGEEDADDADGNGKPDWLQKKIKGEGSLYFHAGLGRWVAWSGYAGDPEPDTEDERRRSTADAGTEDDDPEETARWNSLGEDYERRPYYYHQARRAWVRVAETEQQPEGGGNPWYFTGGPEAGPLTGDTHQFPPHPTGSDPIDPLNQMFPMTPSPWTVPPGGEWKETPMQFDPPGGPNAQRSAAWKAAGEGAVPTPGQNPYYFAGGAEGVIGGPQTSFPADVAKGVDPEDRIDEFYGAQPISAGTVDYGNHVAMRRVAETPHHPAPDSDPMLGTEFDSPQERERYRRAVDGEQQDSRASTSFQAVRRTAARQFFDPADPGVRTIAIGTNPFGADNPFGGDAPAPGATEPGFSNPGTTPATTPPRTMPSSGGPPSGPDQAPSDEAAKQQAQQNLGTAGARHTAAGLTYERPDDNDPTGAGDEYLHNTWDGLINTRPRQSAEHRNINTPQRPQAPIPTLSSPDSFKNNDDDDDEERRREVGRIASLAIRELVGA
jgi:hypothetical protein